MHRSILTILTVLFGTLLYAQTDYIGYKKIKGKEDDFSFPFFDSAANSKAVGKINLLVQLSELNQLYDPKTKDLPVDNGGVAIDFIIKSNTSKMLSIMLNESSCGATCYYWVKYYNFNTQNGDVIQLSDLFSKQGYSQFGNMVYKSRMSQFKKELLKVKDKEDRANLETDIMSKYEEDDLSDFYIKDKYIYIDAENSFSKNEKFFGIETVSHFELKDFEPWLNDYGKCVFGLSNKDVSVYQSVSLPQVFKGTIAGAEVVAVISYGNKNTMFGNYAYLKYGKVIELFGTIKVDNLTLKESNDDDDTIGIITAKYAANKITGTWASADGAKIYNINLLRE